MITKPNHYNFFGIRKLEVPSPHLEYITIPVTYNIEQSITKWVENNLKGRYYVGRTPSQVQGSKLALQIGFEDPKELSYFNLACPFLKYN